MFLLVGCFFVIYVDVFEPTNFDEFGVGVWGGLVWGRPLPLLRN